MMNLGDPRTGDLLRGRYRLGPELGQGGHGVVFRAHDEATHTPVAVKVLRANVKDDPQYAVRLWREAESLRALWGSGVVRVHEFFHDEDGLVFMVMELLQGQTLDDHLLELESFGDRMSSFDVLARLDPIAHALQTAHAKKIIHRDIKPANIFLVDEDVGGGARLMDFGLAKIEGAEQLTTVGMIAGSPSYIAPEMWRAEEFDHRVDVYSLGAVVFRALAGCPPFQGASTVDLYRKATTEARPKLSPLRPELPPEIDRWVERALALNREHRYPDIASMWSDLLALVLQARSPSAYRARAHLQNRGFQLALG